MQLEFHGAARTVTGSCHLVRLRGKTILLDCGLFQGRRKEAFERNRKFEFPVDDVDAVVLSHTHIDHSGNLPSLVRAGFRGPIYSTAATADLCSWMLRDSARIQERDVVYANKRRQRKGQRPFEPLYTTKDAETCLEQFEGVAYAKPTEILPGVQLTFRDAGHILGSASCELRFEEDGRERVLHFTGDVGRDQRPILRDPVLPEEADILISESTYGNRVHPPGEDVRQRLLDVVRAAYDKGGKVLIPAFSVGRTQRLVYEFNDLFDSGQIPPLPIFVDSPLATNVTDVFRDHPECFDEEARALVDKKDDPFGFRRLTYTHDVEASKALNQLRVSAIIIAASGMCEGGRVVHHLKKIAPDPDSTILLVGFMAQHTLGRRIANREATIRIFGDEVPLRAHIESIGGFSGHADRDELLTHLSSLKRPPASTFLVHGELEPATELTEALRSRGFENVEIPKPGQVFDV